MTLNESVDRILAEGTRVTDRFYELFFERHPEARPLFENTFMSAQSVMLSAALVVTTHHPNYPLATRQYLNLLGARHAGKGVPRELFPVFQETLVAALEEFHGTDWDDGLGRQWNEALDRAVQLMFEGYEHRAHD